MSEPVPEFDWRLLRAACIQTGEVTLDDVPRRLVADLALAASKHGLRVTIADSGIKLSLLVHERAPPQERRKEAPALFTARGKKSPVVQLATAEEVYRRAAHFAWESARAVTAEAREVLEEQLAAFRENTEG